MTLSRPLVTRCRHAVVAWLLAGSTWALYGFESVPRAHRPVHP